MGRFGLLLISSAIVGIDQGIKAYVRRFPVGSVLIDVHPLFQIEHHVNTGAAFSILSERTSLISLVSVVLLIVIAFLVCRTMKPTKPALLAFSCLLGGGIGNLIDRIAIGGVTDYINLTLLSFPVFNFADIAISVSVCVLLLLLLVGKLENNTEV